MTENPGGVESVIMNYYHYMDKNTFHFDFLCNSYNKIAFEEEIISNGSQTFHFPARSKNYKKYKKELKNFVEDLKNQNVEMTVIGYFDKTTHFYC